MLELAEYVKDGHSVYMARKFCGNRITWEYDPTYDVLTLDEDDVYKESELEEMFWEFLADIRNFNDEVEKLDLEALCDIIDP